MDGEEKLFVITICVTVVCITILYSFLFLALWDYRQWVGLSLLAVIIAGAVVFPAWQNGRAGFTDNTLPTS